MDNLGQRIYDLRKAAGLTLEDVGTAVGVGKSTVRKWENGIIANMRRDKIKKLASALHTTPAYLMGWTDDPNACEDQEPQQSKKASPSENELAKLLQEPHMKDIYEAALNLTPEHRKMILAQISAVRDLEEGSKK